MLSPCVTQYEKRKTEWEKGWKESAKMIRLQYPDIYIVLGVRGPSNQGERQGGRKRKVGLIALRR